MNTKITSKTHPTGTRFLAVDELTMITSLYELTIVEWSYNGNVKVLCQDGNQRWLPIHEIPKSHEILAKGKSTEDAELHEVFLALVEKVKKAGSTVINDICDAAKEMSEERKEKRK